MQTLAGDNTNAWCTYANKNQGSIWVLNFRAYSPFEHTHNEDQITVKTIGKNARIASLMSGLILTSCSLTLIHLSFIISMKRMRWSWSWKPECSHWESTLSNSTFHSGNFHGAHIQCEAMYCGLIPLSLASHTGLGRYLVQYKYLVKGGRKEWVGRVI